MCQETKTQVVMEVGVGIFTMLQTFCVANQDNLTKSTDYENELVL